MPPPQPKRGLQPSIIDRLVDPESAGTSILSGYTVEKMDSAVSYTHLTLPTILLV